MATDHFPNMVVLHVFQQKRRQPQIPGPFLRARYWPASQIRLLPSLFPVIESSMGYMAKLQKEQDCGHKAGVKISNTKMATWYLVKVR